MQFIIARESPGAKKKVGHVAKVPTGGLRSRWAWRSSRGSRPPRPPRKRDMVP